MRCAIVVLVSVTQLSCGPHGRSRPAAVGETKAAALVREAQATLGAAQRLDYQAPMSPVRIEKRHRAELLFGEACAMGDGAEPCVWAASLALYAPTAPGGREGLLRAVDKLVSLCRGAHDESACRFFDVEEARNPNLYMDAEVSCNQGLMEACYAWSKAHGVEPALEDQLVRRACDGGDYSACNQIRANLTLEEPRDEAAIERSYDKIYRTAEARCAKGWPSGCLYACPPKGNGVQCVYTGSRAKPGVVEGCRRGYLGECGVPFGGEADVDEAQHFRLCSMTGGDCERLSGHLTDPVSIRDALEHGCQFGDWQSCDALADGYHLHKFPEPVPGRGEAIRAYICEPADPTDRHNKYCDGLKAADPAPR